MFLSNVPFERALKMAQKMIFEPILKLKFVSRNFKRAKFMNFERRKILAFAFDSDTLKGRRGNQTRRILRAFQLASK